MICNRLKLIVLAQICIILMTSPCCLANDNTPPVSSDSTESDATTESLEKLQQFFTQGKAYINGRYRFEYVDQDGLPKDAKASTLRTRLGFDTGELYGLSAKLEAENVSEIGNDTYNSTVNGRTDYPVVADPDSTEINQAYATLKAIPETSIRGGREALILDNARFIGDVGWRQNNQTYDGVNISNTSVENLHLFYGYVGNVNRIFGDDSPVGDYSTNLNLFNIRYNANPLLNATTYAYLLDVDDDPTVSSTNFGLHINGECQTTDRLNLFYDTEYAYQQDYENNPLSYSANYWRTQLGAKLDSVKFYGAFESLGSDDGEIGFSTPFATQHAWNGWADKFLTTPTDGLNDAFAGINYTAKDLHPQIPSLAFDAIYHYFSSERNSLKYGEELDLNATAKFLQYFAFGVKYALYDSANFATDTEKLIFTLQAEFTQ